MKSCKLPKNQRISLDEWQTEIGELGIVSSKSSPKELLRKHSDVAGVNWDMRTQKWRVEICSKGTTYCLGYYHDEYDAKQVAREFRKTHPIVNYSLSNIGRRPIKKGSSKFKGVCDTPSNYLAGISKNYKSFYLGCFPRTPEGEIQAARAYDKAALELYGEHAYTNEMEYGEYWK